MYLHCMCVVHDVMYNASLGADDIFTSRDGKQLIVVLLPDDDGEERAFLEQGMFIVCERERERERESGAACCSG